MRRLILYIAVGMIFSFNLKAETNSSDSTKNKSIIKYDSCANKSCNQDCKHMKNNQGNDVFVDKDGDGINDNRCSGMGLGPKWNKADSDKMSGKCGKNCGKMSSGKGRNCKK